MFIERVKNGSIPGSQDALYGPFCVLEKTR